MARYSGQLQTWPKPHMMASESAERIMRALTDRGRPTCVALTVSDSPGPPVGHV